MEKLRRSSAFKKGIALSLAGILIAGAMFIYNVVAKIQYDNIVKNMNSIEATIIDIEERHHRKRVDDQTIYISYNVDRVIYKRLLKTDTKISIDPGIGAKYYVGEKISIFYNPEDPSIIAVPRSLSVGYFFMIMCIFCLLFFVWLLNYFLRNRNKYIVTQEYYKKDDELGKRIIQRLEMVDRDLPIVSVVRFIIAGILLVIIVIKLISLL